MILKGLWSALRNSLKLNAKYLLRRQTRYKSVVEKYPDIISAKVSSDMFLNFRGYIRNDLEKCTGCGACVPSCPVNALSFDSSNKNDGSIQINEFRINLGKCYSCNACIDICPEQSLFYSRDFELVSNKSENLVVVLKGEDVRSEREITRIRTYDVRR